MLLLRDPREVPVLEPLRLLTAGNSVVWHLQLRYAPVRNIDLVYARVCDRHAGSALYQNPIDSPILARSKRLIKGLTQRGLVSYMMLVRHKPTQDDPLVLNRHCLCMYTAHCRGSSA